MAEPKRRKLLGEILKELKKVNQGQIQEALAIQRDKGGQIGTILNGRELHGEEAEAESGT